ncbi:MAG: terminase family protein [Oscillospiraceae bacterium]|nr:terminase family protein [Oscillospiraceae bacterium]
MRMTALTLTEKQKKTAGKVLRSPKRWNISVGAVRSGKTYLDYYVIPRRVIAADRAGQVVLIGLTLETVERNILSPMRKIYSEHFVGRVRKSGRVRLFGRECTVLGAYNAACAEKLRGMSVAYAYGDEVTCWNEEVFIMLKSRLDRETSVFDGSCNPSHPFHWFKVFLDETPPEHINITTFTIDDNTALPPAFVAALKQEYSGTVYYDRYILGKWTAAEGSIYTPFAEAPERFILRDEDVPRIIAADVGVDFGGSGSATAFSLTGYTAGYEKVITLDEFYCGAAMSPAQLEREFVGFIRRNGRYPISDIYCDSAEQMLIRGLENALIRERIAIPVHNAKKSAITDRIHFYLALMSSGRYMMTAHCRHTAEAFASAVWKDERRLDNGSTNIDSLDAQEYSTERRMKEILSVRIPMRKEE